MTDLTHVFIGICVPFIGTALGAAAVFFMKKTLGADVCEALAGFAAGVMSAASVWSLLLPAIDRSAHLGALAFLPALIGFWAGVLLMLLLGKLIPFLQRNAGSSIGAPRTAMMVLAVTLHNIPEGMAVGAAYAVFLEGGGITASAALALALGIAIQNFPEGAIISMPLHADGKPKLLSFSGGILSGVVEPVFAVLTVLFAGIAIPVLPYLLAFAAGAMIYVTVAELIPDAVRNARPARGVLLFAAGFTAMMSLDVALG